MKQDRAKREDRFDTSIAAARRTILKAAGASAAIGVGSGVAGGRSRGGTAAHGSEHGDGSRGPPHIDPVFGKAVAGGNPCANAGDGEPPGDDCFDEFRPPLRPSSEVEVHIDVPGILFALASQGVLSEETTASINEAAADGSIAGDDDTLHKPDQSVTVDLPGGGTEEITVRQIARLVATMVGFHYDPAGLRVEPGDVVLFSAETPDHAVAAYHERHGRQNRVPSGAPPVSSPLIPVGGYWLYRFEDEGVYDLYCPPHQVFGMVMRVVVYDGSGDVPTVEDSVDPGTGRPPEDENWLPSVLGGLDPNVPSSAEALGTNALDPERIVSEDAVHWEEVVAEHRGG
ncbi:cupredoxin domain-containing protein [Halobaculum sp. EA56]|uniref:cupredoxin domain-containing protein n=1 Tax=Halobaculum sp. EA56 TaxID=3421648 RepID=UPI003EBA300D